MRIHSEHISDEKILLSTNPCFSVLHTLPIDQVNEALSAVFDDHPRFLNSSQGFSYNHRHFTPAKSESRDISDTLQDIKKTGYRTIVLSMETSREELPVIAKAAIELEMVGDYVYFVFGDLDPSLVYPLDPDVSKFMFGVQWLQPIDRFWFETEGTFQDPFLEAWKNQTKEDVDRLRAVNPSEPGEPGYFEVNDTIFDDHNPEFGSSFIYDSVVATGMGLCLAFQNDANATIGAKVEGIRSVNFVGASGNVRFCREGCAIADSTREPYSAYWALFNFLEDGSFRITDIDSEDTGFVHILDTVYADGSTVPPPLADFEHNYLSSEVRAFGFALMSCALLMAIVSSFWVFWNRGHRILKASQPLFLHFVCFGSALQASAIFPISFDESNGWSETQLSRACSSIAWLFCLGYIVTYRYAKLKTFAPLRSKEKN